MNELIFYYVTHYLWTFQIIFNLILIAKYIIMWKKHKKDSMLLNPLLFVFGGAMTLMWGYVILMFDYIHNTRINGPIYWYLEAIITICLVSATLSLWLIANWRFTWYEDRFVFRNARLIKKVIYISDIDVEKSFISRYRRPDVGHFEIDTHMNFVLKNGKLIKVPYEDMVCSNSDVMWDIKLRRFLTENLGIKTITKRADATKR